MTINFYAQLDFNGLDHKLGQFHIFTSAGIEHSGYNLGEEHDQRGVKTEGQIIIIQLQIELAGILSHSRKGKKQC